MSNKESPSSGTNLWSLIKVFFILGFMIVSVVVIGLFLQNAGWIHLNSEWIAAPGPRTTAMDLFKASSDSLREKLERVAAMAIRTPTIHPRIQEVIIESPKLSMQRAADPIHEVLKNHHLQYVEAVESDLIKIIIIVPSKEWQELSGNLQTAAEQSGLVYRGPSSTVTADTADTLVADIQILRKPAGSNSVHK